MFVVLVEDHRFEILHLGRYLFDMWLLNVF